MQERDSLNRIVKFGVISVGLVAVFLYFYLSGAFLWKTFTMSGMLDCERAELVYTHLKGDGLRVEIANDCSPRGIWFEGNDSVVIVYLDYPKLKGTVVKSEGVNNTVVFTCFYECGGWFKLFPVKVDNGTHIISQNDIIRLEHRFNEMENDTYNLKDVMPLREKWC